MLEYSHFISNYLSIECTSLLPNLSIAFISDSGENVLLYSIFQN